MSRVAVLSDIHGNLPALRAVIADAGMVGCRRFLNLGDSLSGPLWPAETADLLIQLGWPTIAGNHERQLLGARAGMGASDALAADRATESHRTWIASLPPTLVLGDLLLCHGTPVSDVEHLLFTVGRDGLSDAADDEIAARLDADRVPLTLCGHSHRPADRMFAPGRRAINPGSVGLQAFTDDRPHPYNVSNGDPRARYAVLHDGEVEFRRVAYDHRAAARKAVAEGFADWACWLETGRA